MLHRVVCHQLLSIEGRQQAATQLQASYLGCEMLISRMPLLSRDTCASAGFQAQWQDDDEPRGLLAWWFLNREREHKLDSLDLPLLGSAFQRRGVPPKNVFALERTYLAWIHMAITVGAVAAALVGVAGGSSPRSEKVGRWRPAILSQDRRRQCAWKRCLSWLPVHLLAS